MAHYDSLSIYDAAPPLTNKPDVIVGDFVFITDTTGNGTEIGDVSEFIKNGYKGTGGESPTFPPQIWI